MIGQNLTAAEIIASDTGIDDRLFEFLKIFRNGKNQFQRPVQILLTERPGQNHASGIFDKIGIAAIAGTNHRRTATQRLKQDHSGRFTAGGMDQQISSSQQMRHIVAGSQKNDPVINAATFGKIPEI